MSPEGYPFIFIAFLVFLILAVWAWRTGKTAVRLACVISFLLMILFLWFFRDPYRELPAEINAITSPADGRVVQVDSTWLEEAGETRRRISIYLSLFDVHVNRSPVTGRVILSKHISGRFHPAFSDKASKDNESQLMGLDTGHGVFYIRQIAGMVARRIVCRARPGDCLKRGEKYGMIKFGSRVDLFLPDSVRLVCQTGDRLKAGESIIGYLP